MKIFVTGNRGFIGTHLSAYLKSLGHEVKGFDLLGGESFKHSDGFTYSEKQDTRVVLKIDLSIEAFQPDIVIHLAALPGVLKSLTEYADYYATNITGTHNVLEACVKHNVKKVLVASSSCVSGNGTSGAMTEYDPYNPVSPYGVSKVGTEFICKMFAHKIPVSVFRPFTVYGENGRPEMVIAKLIDCARNNKLFHRYGDGNTTRGYTNVHDLCEGIEKLMDFLPDTNDDLSIFNLGGQEQIKLNDLIEIVESELGEMEKDEVPQPDADMSHSLADISKAKDILGWNPKRNFRDEIIKLCK